MMRRPGQPEPAGAASRPSASPNAERPSRWPLRDHRPGERRGDRRAGPGCPAGRLPGFLQREPDPRRLARLHSHRPDRGRRPVPRRPAGRVRLDRAVRAPSGLLPRGPEPTRSSDLILSRDAPVARKDYTVRRGRAWDSTSAGTTAGRWWMRRFISWEATPRTSRRTPPYRTDPARRSSPCRRTAGSSSAAWGAPTST